MPISGNSNLLPQMGVFAVNSTLPPYLQGGGSTRCMWSREKFDKITLMLIPLNLFG